MKKIEEKDWRFYKNITAKIGIALHINKVIDQKYFKILWGNKTYIDIAGRSIKERNKDTSHFHKMVYTKQGTSDIKETLLKSLRYNNSYSAMYKNKANPQKCSWILTQAKVFKKDDQNNLKQIICASVDLTNSKNHIYQYDKIQKEIIQTKNKLSISKLSKKEIEILQLLSSGKSEKEIANIQSRSIHTVKTHLKNIRKKLNFNKNTELVKFAIETGIG
jgi:DNA-binding CsgD family transcriptional regulator